MDLLSLIQDPRLFSDAQRFAADPLLQTGLGLLSSAYDINAPFAGASAGLNAASRASADATRSAATRMAMGEAMQRQSLLDVIGNAQAWSPEMRAMAQLAPEAFVTGAMKNMGAAAATPGAGRLTREELLKEYDLGKSTPESVEAMMAEGAASGGYDPGMLRPKAATHGFSEEQALRKEAGQRTEPIRLGVNKGKQLLAMLDRKGPVSDVAALYSLVSALDPESVVREGEVSLVNSATGLWNQLLSNVQRAQGQGFLTPAMKADMRGVTMKLMKLYQEQDANFRDYYGRVAGQYPGIDPSRVTGAPIRFPEGLGAGEWTPASSEVEEVVRSGTATPVNY